MGRLALRASMGVRMKALALVACAFFAAVVSVEAAVEEDGRAGDGILYSLDSSAGIAAEGDEGGVATLQEPMDLLQLQTDAKEGALFKTQGRTPATPVNEGWSWAHYTLFDPVKDAKRASHMRVNCIRICNSNRCVGKDNKGKTCLLNPTVLPRPAICEESTPGNGKVCQLNDGKTACKSSDGCRFTAARQAQVGGKRCAKPDRGCKFVPKPVNPDTAIKVTEEEKKPKTNTNTTAGNSSHPEYKFGYKAALKARNKTSVDGTSSKRAKKADNGTVSNADLAKTGGSSSSAAAQAGSSAAPTTGKTTGKIAAADKAAEKADKRAKKKAAADKKKAEKAKAEAEAAKAKELDSKASAEKAKKTKEAAKEKDTKAKSVEEQAAKAKASAEKKTKAAKSAAAKAQAEKDEKEKNGKEADSKEKQKAAEIKKKAAEQKRIQEKNKEIADKKAAADAKAKAKEAKEKKEASAKKSSEAKAKKSAAATKAA